MYDKNASTKLYNTLMGNPSMNNAIGRTSGLIASSPSNDNFFIKRGRSIENTFGTTGAAIASGLYDRAENAATENLLKDNTARMNDIAKKYGYNSYHDVWDARDRAEAAGDQTTLNLIDNTINPELQAQADANDRLANEKAAAYEDYRKNNYVSKKINQDRGKFLGSAINTLSTAVDLTGLGASPVANAIQGGVEGIADELEQSGLENFDLQRAGQNALIGATTGAVTGALNKGLSNSLAKRGGNLFKGGNAITKGLNDLGSRTALGRVGSTIATGAGRGALSGAVGGATGAGLSAAMNNQDVLGSALQGAVQGAKGGAMTGAAMAGANMAISNTPGVGKFYNELQSARNRWDQSGENFDERLTNTLTSGDSAVGDWLMGKRQSKLLGVAGDLGNRIQDVSNNNYKALNDKDLELRELTSHWSNGNYKNKDDFYRLHGDINDFDSMLFTNKSTGETLRGSQLRAKGIFDNLYADSDFRNFGMGRNNSLGGANSLNEFNLYVESDSADNLSNVLNDFTDWQAVSDWNDNRVSIQQTPTTAAGWLKKAGERIVEDANNRGVGLSIKDVGGDDNNNVNRLNSLNPTGTVNTEYDPSFRATALLGDDITTYDRTANISPDQEITIYRGVPADVEGSINAGDYVTTNRQLAQDYAGSGRVIEQRVPASSLLDSVSEPLGEEYIYRPQMQTSPETELYRTVTSETEQSRTPNADLMYGESELSNRTKRDMITGGMERLGNTLEGAQTNVTRAAAKDIGIESPGKVVENVRKKTGLTNLETQADFAKEITGGENSLLDNIQRIALTATEDGSTYSVDTSPVVKEVGAIVDKYADSNTFGSPTAKEKFVRNLKKDIANGGSDILSISNRMKASAADLRGKGVGQVPAADAAKAKIYTEVAGVLDDLSYKAIPQDNVDAMFDTAISEMRGRATQAVNNGNRKIAKAWNQSADSLAAQPRTIKNFRSWKKDFVDVSKVNKLTLQAENGAAAQMGRSFGGGVKRLVGTLAQRPVNTLLAKTGGAINSIADRISGDNVPGTTTTVTPTETMNTNTYSPSTRLYDAIGRTEGLTNAEQARTANYLADAAQEAEVVPKAPTAGVNTLEGLISPTTSGNATSVYNSVYGNGNTQTASTSYFQPTGDYWTDILAKAMSSAIDADDVTAFASLYGMYQDALSNIQKESTGTQKLSATQQRANAAMNSLERLSGMTPDLAYNLSNIPLVGGIATFGGNDYESEAKSLAQQIGYMVSGSNIKESEAEAIGKSYVPQPWDNEQVRQNKLRRAYEIISQYQNAYVE